MIWSCSVLIGTPGPGRRNRPRSVIQTKTANKKKARETSTVANQQQLFTKRWFWFWRLDAEKMMKYWVNQIQVFKEVRWDAANEDEQMRFMEWGQGWEKKNFKGDTVEAERRNAQKLLKSCQSHSWGFGIGKAISGYVKHQPFHLPIWRGADSSSCCVGKVCRREM